jgi:hypothetical protein
MRKRLCATLAALGLLLAVPARAQKEFNVGLTRAHNSATLSGRIRDDAEHRYIVTARAGQTLTVDFKPTNASAYFNILAPRSNGEAMFVGSSSGNHFTGALPANGAYAIQVYLMRNAARRNEVANYTISIGLRGGAASTFRPSVDATVPGTPYNATADISCITSDGATAGACKAGVIRHGGGTATVELKTPDGGQRRIFFTKGQATGSDAVATFNVSRQGDLQIVRIGAIEVYRIPDALVVGG